MSLIVKCRRCPIMCGYGPLTAGMPELDKAPKDYNPMPEGYLRETSNGMVDDLYEFCRQHYQAQSEQ